MKKVEMKIKTKIALSMVAGGLAGTALTGFGLYELVKRSPDLMPDLAIQIGIAAWGVFLLIAGVLHFCVEGGHKKDLLTADDLKTLVENRKE